MMWEWNRMSSTIDPIKAMTVPSSLILLAILVHFVRPSLGQTPAKRFHWDSNRVEKNWEQIIQSKDLSARERAAFD